MDKTFRAAPTRKFQPPKRKLLFSNDVRKEVHSNFQAVPDDLSLSDAAGLARSLIFHFSKSMQTHVFFREVPMAQVD